MKKILVIVGMTVFIFALGSAAQSVNYGVLVQQTMTVSEPAAMFLLGCGLIGLAAWGRRRFPKP